MAGLSVQFNRLSAGAGYVDHQKIDPIHKKSLEENLFKIFQRNLDTSKIQNSPFKISLKPKKTVLQVGDKEIELGKSRELRRVGNILRYYQHTGHLPKEVMSPKDVIQRDSETKKLVREMHQASIPGANGSILAGMRVAEDTLSLSRNIIFALSEFGTSDPIANHLGYYAGIFWSFFALRELDDGLIEYKRSKRIQDQEGKERAQARVLSGSVISAASLSYLSAKVCNTLDFAGVSSALSGVANGLFGVGALIGMGTSVLGGIRCSRFNRRLNEYLDNPRLSEAECMRGAVQFLKDSIIVTPEERLALIHEIDQKCPQRTLEQKEKLLQQKIADLTEVKVKYMKRRTSNRSLQLILSQADRILAKLADPATRVEGIQEAAILVNAIQKENKIKMNLYILGFFAALITLVGMAIMFFGTAGVLPFVFYSTAGTIYLCLTIYTIAGTLLKGEGDIKAIEACPVTT